MEPLRIANMIRMALEPHKYLANPTRDACQQFAATWWAAAEICRRVNGMKLEIYDGLIETIKEKIKQEQEERRERNKETEEWMSERFDW